MEGRSRADEDLTARARIREAALRVFAERGVSGATIRGIAEAAGVSAGLVQHHFGSKEALRRACDEYAIDVLTSMKWDALKGGFATPGFMPKAQAVGLPVQRYLARALVDGSPAAAELFDQAVEFSEGMVVLGAPGVSPAETSDPRAYATVLTAMIFGVTVLHEHLARNLGADPLTPDGQPRMSLAMLDILSDDVMSPELLAQSRAAIERMRPPAPDGAAADRELRIPTSDAAARKTDSDPPA
ncbi:MULTISPECIES: TetR/AcrR family transcriptional regulator [unclassified Spirillospora]|uniref:TetR/AcrR family transcriptional regulator n=1 Tax=unclassified Spirillospora TaxID=2642701 RepID=UPI003714E95E